MSRHVTKRWILLLLLALASPASRACGCDKPKTPEQVRYFVHMFKGQVLRSLTSYEYGALHQTVEFKVLEHIRGAPSDSITVSFGGKTSCDLEKPAFKVGQVYLISDQDVFRAKDNAGVANPKLWKPSGQFEGNFCSLRQLVEDPGDGVSTRMSKEAPSVPASDWRTTDLLYIARDLDVTSFPNSIGPSRRPDAKTLGQYGYTQVTARPGMVEFTLADGSWYFAVEMIQDRGDIKELCVSDRAMNLGTYNARTRVKVKRGAKGYYEAIEPPPEGGHSC